jgi:cytoskeletal protein CcmA (bactofilin family)
MFASRQKGTVIAKGLKIVGSVTAEGLVEVNGEIEGELHGISLLISQGARVVGTITAQRVVVDGSVEGPIQGGDVILKSHAVVVGNIRHRSLSIENGAIFEGCSARAQGAEGQEAERVIKKPLRERNREILSAAE